MPIKFFREHFLAELAICENFTRMAELGLWKGRTFLHLLKSCPNLTIIGVDTWSVKDESLDEPGFQDYRHWDMKTYELDVRTNAEQFGKRAMILKMDTVQASAFVEDGSLDCVFIDADHTSVGVKREIEAWKPKIRPGGYLTGHDCDWPSVRTVIDELVPGWNTATDNVWWIQV
jgi:hypothetical protein